MKNLHKSDFDRQLERNLTKVFGLLLVFLVMVFCVLGVGAAIALFLHEKT